ncbi:PQQ-binding-like beta-propeller repeat protein [Rhodomicrobium sp. Az07]|uniref:outer membrane protein assembly factor BamB family protein n=1 Tax=Rhodomicrobium sp. Az07 TaxID=2839034 RepID=UPI001BE50427|nr:PQQ-binding-like beta-propeller repeat protein [Rhodomicrobium sp. Az07]MBT3070557.1 PQQ-binding-like beta-propeller repeat protein [Rhodomicrobium sp. Az07]
MPSISSVTSVFDKKEEKLPGKRVSVLGGVEDKGSIAAAEVASPVSLPPAVMNASWSQPGGVPTNAPGHLAFGQNMRTAWTASAGEGSSKRMRLTAIPIVYDGKVYTLDAEGTVRAISMENGGTVWRMSTVPDEKAEFDIFRPFNSNNHSRAGFGGGLAADSGKIFVATGFGTVLALDAGTGSPIWTKKILIPIREAPTAADGRVYIVNAESELYCLSANDGSELWTQKGLPENAAVLTSASPAVSGNLVFVPFPSGEITAIDVKTGEPKWTEMLSKTDITNSSAAIGEAARPVVDRDMLFAMSRAGQLIATSRDKGQRIWTRDIRGSQTPWVAGDTVFVVDTTGKLIALNRKDGKARWVAQLPGDGRWSGPVLAGGKLWLASSKGLFAGVDAANGQIQTQANLGSPVMISPVVANGWLFVLTDKAELIAMN